MKYVPNSEFVSEQKGFLLKRAFTSLCAAALLLAVAASVAAAPAPQPQPKKTPASSHSSKTTSKLSKWQQYILTQMKVSAPGDEYFGRMKMSYLGINNTFHDDAIRAGEYTTDPELVSSIEWADEALTAWAKKYPNDPQLARSYFLAFLMYRKVYTPVYQQKAWDYAHIVIKKWPSEFFRQSVEKRSRNRLHRILFRNAGAVHGGRSVRSSDRQFEGAPTPTPPALTPSPSPSPTPSPRPGQPKVSHTSGTMHCSDAVAVTGS